MTRSDEEIEALARLVTDCAYHIHRDIGPGLLESAYEIFLAAALTERGPSFERQKSIDAVYKGVTVRDAFRVDILVEGKLVVEIKSVERLAPVHRKQMHTYLGLTGLPLGLLINFGSGLFKDGADRVINPNSDFVGKYKGQQK